MANEPDNTKQEDLNKTIRAIIELTKQLPHFDSSNYSYDAFIESFKQESTKCLHCSFGSYSTFDKNNKINCPENSKIFDFNYEEGTTEEKKEENGLMFSVYKHGEDISSRQNFFYEGKVWSGNDEKSKCQNFYDLFKFCTKIDVQNASWLSDEERRLSLIDFLLFKCRMIPQQLHVYSSDENEQSETYAHLVVPTVETGPLFHTFDDYKKKLTDQLNGDLAKESSKREIEGSQQYNHYAIQQRILEDGYTDTNLVEAVEACINDITEDMVKDFRTSLENSGVELPAFPVEANNEENEKETTLLKNVIFMHSISSRYAPNLIIFSSGSYGSATGLVFSCTPSNDNNSNWQQILQNREAITFLDSKLRRINEVEISNEENVLSRKLRKAYDDRLERYEQLKKFAVALVLQICSNRKVKVHKIESRIKDFESLQKKIKGKNSVYYRQHDYEKLFSECQSCNEIDNEEKCPEYQSFKSSVQNNHFDGKISDLCGVRVILESNDDMDRFLDKDDLKKFFDICECSHKHQVDTTSFSYASSHYILSLNDHSINFLFGLDDQSTDESIQLKKCKFELQVRTLLQHGWASTSHENFYKGDEIKKISDQKKMRIERRMNALSGTLEHVDLSLSEIKKSIQDESDS